MSEIYDIDRDVREAEAMVKGFERYLKGRELYGSVSGGFFWVRQHAQPDYRGVGDALAALDHFERSTAK